MKYEGRRIRGSTVKGLLAAFVTFATPRARVSPIICSLVVFNQPGLGPESG
jgi:hypothetical protein